MIRFEFISSAAVGVLQRSSLLFSKWAECPLVWSTFQSTLGFVLPCGDAHCELKHVLVLLIPGLCSSAGLLAAVQMGSVDVADAFALKN
ncbi:hypothetical protein Nepgr_018727 [Nepenthes gracilis]|uniref:Uncharacterized protein n=1 Tax=Nepenthes gracilis TaxID=150966 RepID=A0AAD3SU43_NEPGR|nr:hypothetical protein Nepgr_018727 [Nepenthes gracilis]